MPDDARRNAAEEEPTHSGNGFVKYYLTKDIDREVGTRGQRQEVASNSGKWHSPSTPGNTPFCKFDDIGSDDNMHIDANIAGFWINLIYGGSVGSHAEDWAWIRKIQACQHD